MGYYTTFHGELTFDRPLLDVDTYNKIKSLVEEEFGKWEVNLEPEKLEFNWLNGKFGDFEDQIAFVVDTLKKYGRRVAGEIVATGEEPGDIWRVKVHGSDSVVTREDAKIRWPDGTEYRA